MHTGTPPENTSGVPFPEAVLIWSGPGCDWHAAIAAIIPDPQAGHYRRPTDRIPLRPEQMRCDILDLKHLLKLQSQKIVRWNFVPIGAAAAVVSFSKDELEFYEAVDWDCGLKTRKLFPYLVSYLRARGWTNPYLRAQFNPSSFGIGGAKLLVGHPPVPYSDLNQLATSELVIVPHISSRGPNGFWRIERGEKHHLMLAVSQLRVYGLFSEDGQPAFNFLIDQNIDGYPPDSCTARGVDLFTSEATARDWANDCVEDGEPALSVKEMTARELLRCLSSVDVALINMMDFAVTHRGAVALGIKDIAPDQDLLAALAVQSSI
jgi:hypothetical protein